MAGTLLVAVVAFAHLLTVALTYPASDKIVGGWPAALGQYPYQVLYTTVHCTVSITNYYIQHTRSHYCV